MEVQEDIGVVVSLMKPRQDEFSTITALIHFFYHAAT